MNTIKERVIAHLTYQLDADELEVAQDELLKSSRMIDTLKLELREHISFVKNEIKEHEAEVKRLLVEVCTQKRTDDVDAIKIIDVPNRKQWIEYRGQRFDERNLTFDEISQYVNSDRGLTPIGPNDIKEALGAVGSKIKDIAFADDGDQDIRDIIKAETSMRSKKDHLG